MTMLREAQRAIDCGDAGFSVPFRLWLLRALAIGRRRDRLRDTTLVQYRTDLKRRLDRIMAYAVPQGREAAPAHRPLPGAPTVFVADRRAADQQRLRARAAAERGVPQGHERVPLGMGRRDLRRVSIRRQHRENQRQHRAERRSRGAA